MRDLGGIFFWRIPYTASYSPPTTVESKSSLRLSQGLDIHDPENPWRTKTSPNLLKVDMSHGCLINPKQLCFFSLLNLNRPERFSRSWDPENKKLKGRNKKLYTPRKLRWNPKSWRFGSDRCSFSKEGGKSQVPAVRSFLGGLQLRVTNP